MDVTDKYYNKVYKETLKLTKKLFGKNINECVTEKYNLKKYFEDLFKKPIEEINSNMLQNKRTELIKSGNAGVFFKWAKYKTLSKILETLESACVLKTSIIKEYEHEC
mgnify:CR=1 FL=1